MGRAAFEVVRSSARQELVEQNTQAVDVAGSRERFSAHLLRAGVLGRQNPLVLSRYGEREVSQVRIEELGNAEVEQFDLAVANSRGYSRA